MPSSLLDRRPDVVAAERQVLAAFNTAEAARLARFPSFTLNFEGGRVSDPVLSLVNLNSWYYNAAVGMTVPVYTGGRLTAQVKIATSGQQQAMAHYGAIFLNAFEEVETALTNENTYARQFEHLENSFREYTDVRIATIRYKAGAFDMQQVLQLQTSQLAVQEEVTRLQGARLTNRIILHLALGGGFEAAPAVVPVR